MTHLCQIPKEHLWDVAAQTESKVGKTTVSKRCAVNHLVPAALIKLRSPVLEMTGDSLFEAIRQTLSVDSVHP